MSETKNIKKMKAVRLSPRCTRRRVLLGQRYHHREGPQGDRGLRTAGTASQSA